MMKFQSPLYKNFQQSMRFLLINDANPWFNVKTIVWLSPGCNKFVLPKAFNSGFVCQCFFEGVQSNWTTSLPAVCVFFTVITSILFVLNLILFLKYQKYTIIRNQIHKMVYPNVLKRYPTYTPSSLVRGFQEFQSSFFMVYSYFRKVIVTWRGYFSKTK
jgi:hypothetical protein